MPVHSSLLTRLLLQLTAQGCRELSYCMMDALAFKPVAHMRGPSVHCSSRTRDRLKLIPRVVNVDQWAVEGPLSGAEHKLLANYNDKPLMTKPQHRCFRGPNYFEIDIDVHSYAFIARRVGRSCTELCDLSQQG